MLIDGVRHTVVIEVAARRPGCRRIPRQWRAAPAHRGRTCRAGLWRYSRHPNYFFEWIHWLVYPVIGIGLPYGGALWLAPALMLFLVLRVTGIPPTEEQALRSRGADYRDYQETTSAFVPWPPKRRQSPMSHELAVEPSRSPESGRRPR